MFVGQKKECFKHFGQALADFHSQLQTEYLEDDHNLKNMIQQGN